MLALMVTTIRSFKHWRSQDFIAGGPGEGKGHASPQVWGGGGGGGGAPP